MFELLNKLIKLKVHNDLIEEWLKSQNFFKNLESILCFNFSDTSSFIKTLEESRKEFNNNPESKKLKVESKKFSRYYVKFLYFFRNSLYNSQVFKRDEEIPSKSEDKKSPNYEVRSFLKGNKLNMPEFVFEKIREFLKFCLFKTQEKTSYSDSKKKITSFFSTSKGNDILNSNPNEPKLSFPANDKTPSAKTTPIEVFRQEVLDNIFKNFKSYTQNEGHIYMEINWKLYDLNDLNLMQFHMLLFDILTEKIIENENFFDQISINNW